jgi:hypothetical protein
MIRECVTTWVMKTTRCEYWIPALARKGSRGRNDGREVELIIIK